MKKKMFIYTSRLSTFRLPSVDDTCCRLFLSRIGFPNWSSHIARQITRGESPASRETAGDNVTAVTSVSIKILAELTCRLIRMIRSIPAVLSFSLSLCLSRVFPLDETSYDGNYLIATNEMANL